MEDFTLNNNEAKEMTAEELYKKGMQIYDAREQDRNNEFNSVPYFKKSAEMGYLPAQRMMVSVYIAPFYRINKNEEKWMYWLKLAAEQGDIECQTALASSYYNGTGVKKDIRQAVYWWKQAYESVDELNPLRLGLEDGVFSWPDVKKYVEEYDRNKLNGGKPDQESDKNADQNKKGLFSRIFGKK